MNKFYTIVLSFSLILPVGVKAHPSNPKKKQVARIAKDHITQRHPRIKREVYPRLSECICSHDLLMQYARAIDWQQKKIRCTSIPTPESFFPYNKSHLQGWTQRTRN